MGKGLLGIKASKEVYWGKVCRDYKIKPHAITCREQQVVILSAQSMNRLVLGRRKKMK